jgi:hypothetical protein
MVETKEISKSKQIRTLLLVVGSGVTAALVLALFMLYYYNPSGTYLAGNVLLAPDSALNLRYIETNHRTKDASRFVFAGIEFSFYDTVQKKWQRKKIEMDKYREFYAQVEGDRSLTDIDDNVRKSFTSRYPATLSLSIHLENDTTAANNKEFSQAVFSEGSDYYRVQLRDQGSSEGWAYFYHPGIYSKIMKIFSNE